MNVALRQPAPQWQPTPSGAVEIARDLAFGRAGDTDLLLDIYRPSDAEGALPLVVYLHGGGWRAGSRSDREDVRQIPLAAGGFAVASVEYRLSGVAPFPAPLDDARLALRWLRQNAERLGVDPKRVAIAGGSAGAHLAALLALSAREPIDRVGAVISWFPVTDLVGWDQEWRTAPHPAPGTFAAQGAARRGWPPPERAAGLYGVAHVEDAPADLVRAADPRSYIADAVAPRPPFLILHGDADTAVDQHHAKLLHDALRAGGIESTLLILGDADHEDAAFGRPTPLGAVIGFLNAALSG